MARPIISVVIPVYNVEKYLKRCLDTIINQTLRDIEIILVDDGSKDKSGLMCDEIKATDSRIKVIHQPNGGLGFARNSGLKAASGEYISFIDSDDYVSLDMYEKLYECLKGSGAETCIFGLHKVRNGEIIYTRTNDLKGTFRGQEAFTDIFLNVLGTEPSYPHDFRILWQSSCLSLYSMDLIRKYNICFPSEGEFVTFNEDIFFNMDYYIRTSSVTILNEPFYYYCENQNTITTSFKADRFMKEVNHYGEQIKRAAGYLTDTEKYRKAEERMQRSFLASARYCVMLVSAFCSFREGCLHIMEICNNPVLQDILGKYPWARNPLKYRVFNCLLKKRMARILYFMAKFRK